MWKALSSAELIHHRLGVAILIVFIAELIAFPILVAHHYGLVVVGGSANGAPGIIDEVTDQVGVYEDCSKSETNNWTPLSPERFSLARPNGLVIGILDDVGKNCEVKSESDAVSKGP